MTENVQHKSKHRRVAKAEHPKTRLFEMCLLINAFAGCLACWFDCLFVYWAVCLWAWLFLFLCSSAGQTNEHSNKQANKQTSKQTNKQTDMSPQMDTDSNSHKSLGKFVSRACEEINPSAECSPQVGLHWLLTCWKSAFAFWWTGSVSSESGIMKHRRVAKVGHQKTRLFGMCVLINAFARCLAC